MSSKDQHDSAATFSYFDGQKVGVPLGAFIALVTLGLFFEQFDLANFGYTAPAMAKYWKLGMDWVGKTNGLGSFGMMAGAFIGGWFSDKVGRKVAFLISTALYGISTVLCGMAPTPLYFVIGRIVTMMGVSALAVTAMVYVAEMVPAGQRGALSMRVLAIGMLANPLTGLFAKWVVAKGPEGWRWQYYWGGAFALIEVVLVYFICYESPRWLVSKGKTAKAKTILERILHGVTVDESALVAERASRKAVDRLGTLRAFGTMWNSFYRRRSILLMLMAIVGSNVTATVGMMLPMIFKTRGFSMGDSILLVSLFGWGIPVGTMIASFAVDKGGRKVPLAICGMASGCLLTTLGFVNGFTSTAIVGVAMQLFNAMYIFSTQVYTTESFGTKIRNTAVGVCVGTGRLASAVWMGYMAVFYAFLGFSGLFVVLGGGLFLIMIGVLIFGHNTSKRTLEDISGEAAPHAAAAH